MSAVSKIQIRRGAFGSMPTLRAGELYFCTDTYDVYIGDGATNHIVTGDPNALQLDQTTPQTVSNGLPVFSSGIQAGTGSKFQETSGILELESPSGVMNLKSDYWNKTTEIDFWSTDAVYAEPAYGDVLMYDPSINRARFLPQGGTYTPTRSNESNLDSNITPTLAHYSRNGTHVTVSGRFTADATTFGVATSFQFSLPVASDFNSYENCCGVAVSTATSTTEMAEIYANTANNTAHFFWTSSNGLSATWTYTFTYTII